MIPDMRGAVMGTPVMLAACGSWTTISPYDLANHGGETVRAMTAEGTVVFDEAILDGDAIVGTVHRRDQQVVRIPIRSVYSVEVHDGSKGTLIALGIVGGATVVVIAILVTIANSSHSGGVRF